VSRFLRSPSLFPARMSGEPWGAETVVVDLPGGPFRVSGLSDEQVASIGDRFPKRAATGDGYAIEVFRASPSDFLPVETKGWEYDLEIDGPAIVGMDLMARVESDRAAIWTTVTSRDAFWGVVENVLRPLVARRLLAEGGLLVHGAGAVFSDRGFLFCGPSGAGKSTIAGLAIAEGREVFSDDLNAIVGDSIVPLPFTGDLAAKELRSAPARLHTIVALEKGSSDAIRPLSVPQTVSLLVRCSPYVNRDAALGQTLLDRAVDVARTARGAVLTFRRDGDVCPILDSW